MTLHATHYGWCQLHQSQGLKKHFITYIHVISLC